VNNLLLGFWRAMIPLPNSVWQGQIIKEARRIKAALGFMSQEHRLVHYFVVRELPRLGGVGEPLAPEFIAQRLNLPVSRVNGILDELERHKTFLFRNAQGAVAWAYPVTVDKTPHHVTFDTGEQVYAA
jgi:hypothetical protein